MTFAEIGPGHIGVFIPIIAVLGGIFVAITAIMTNGRKKELEHKERIVAMEKGLELPEPTPEIRKPVYSGRRAMGLVMFGIGLALTIGLWVEDGARTGVWGLIPLAIGLALLTAAVLDKREFEAREAKLERERSMGTQ